MDIINIKIIYFSSEFSFETKEFGCLDPCVYLLEGTDRKYVIFCFDFDFEAESLSLTVVGRGRGGTTGFYLGYKKITG